MLGWNNWVIPVLCELVFDSERAVVRARSTYWGKYLLQSPKTGEQVFASVSRSAGSEELRQACVNLSTQKELKCERGKDRAGAGHIAIGNRTLGCQWFVLWAENMSLYVDFLEPKQFAFSIEHHPVHWRNPWYQTLFFVNSLLFYLNPHWYDHPDIEIFVLWQLFVGITLKFAGIDQQS